MSISKFKKYTFTKIITIAVIFTFIFSDFVLSEQYEGMSYLSAQSRFNPIVSIRERGDDFEIVDETPSDALRQQFAGDAKRVYSRLLETEASKLGISPLSLGVMLERHFAAIECRRSADRYRS